MSICPICQSATEADKNYGGDGCSLLMSAYILAGLAMMLNIRLSYSSAPYALIRFQLPENLFSVFVRRMASALELWCLPSMLLGNIMDLFQKLLFDGPMVRGLKNARDYDIQSTNTVPQRLKDKATELQDAANTLSTEAGSAGAGAVGEKASSLATSAGQLNTEADNIQGGNLESLKSLAQELAKAAGTTSTSGLAKKADELSKEQTNHDKAIAVIDAFNKVKTGYVALSSKDKYQQLLKSQSPGAGSDADKVQKVQGAWTSVRGNFEKLCMALINHFAGQVETAARELSGESGTTSTHADSVINNFYVVESAYKELSATANISKEYYTVKQIHDGILNLTKLHKAATALHSAAQSPASLNDLKTAADTLKQNVETLRNTGDDAKNVKSQYETVKEKFDALAEGADKGNVQTQFWALNGSYSHIIIHDKPWKFGWIIVPSIVSQWLNFLTYVILLIVYLMGGDQGRLTTFYWVIAISGVVFGINMTLVYSVDFYYIPVYIAGENSFPIITSFIHYLSTLMFGNRRKWNSDFLLVEIDIWVAIIISFVAAVVWTYGYLCEGTDDIGQMKHIHAHGFGGNPNWYQISPFLMIVVGMGLVYAIYPGIAPGMIVPFYLIDKIEMVLLIATIFPPVIIAILRIKAKAWSPQHNTGTFNLWKPYEYDPTWTGQNMIKVHAYLWHLFDLLMVIKIILAIIFIYSLHYRDSHLSRSIINQPKMSTTLSITFYMCHEILLAVGFSGFIGNDGGDYILIPQYIGALFMIFLAFYSEGYIIEYKSHDPANWPTEGMKNGMWDEFPIPLEIIFIWILPIEP